MGEEFHRDLSLEDVGDLVRLNEQMVVEKKEEAAEAGIVLSEEVKGCRCTHCSRVFSNCKALGGHMSSVHWPFKKFVSSSKKLKSMKEITNQKNPTDFQIGKFTCKYCGKNFSSEKAVHGHMRLHPDRDRRGMKPPTELEIENPTAYSLEPKILADVFDSEHLLIAPTEDFIKNLREKTVTGKRGRRGTKPHKVDSPETYLEKRKALLSGDPQELRKILDHHDDSGYFGRAFGKFLEFPWPEIEKKRDIQGGSEMGNNEISENLATTSSYYCSNCPLVCSKKVIAYSISKDIYETCVVLESKNHEHGKQLEGTTSIENRLTAAKKRKRMDSNFVESKIVKKMKTTHSHTAQRSDKYTRLPAGFVADLTVS